GVQTCALPFSNAGDGVGDGDVDRPQPEDLMATIDSTGAGAVRPFEDFKEAYEVWPRGDRLEAIRTAAASFKQRFRQQKQILGVQIGRASCRERVESARGGVGIEKEQMREEHCDR